MVQMIRCPESPAGQSISAEFCSTTDLLPDEKKVQPCPTATPHSHPKAADVSFNAAKTAQLLMSPPRWASHGPARQSG